MTDQTTIPRAPLWLGLAGLIPFWGLAIGLAFAPVYGVTLAQMALALSAYAAVIVSFLGGIRWGLATVATAEQARGQFELAVIPSLVAWGALALPLTPSLALLGLFALVLGRADRSLVTEGLAPPWFARLRLILSGGAGAALLLGAAVSVVRA